MKKILTIILATSLLVACADDFTDIDPVGALSDASLQNATGVDLLLTGAYSVLDGIRNGGPGADWTKSGDNWWLDAISDDAHKGSTDGDQADLLLLNFLHGILQTHTWKEDGKPYLLVLTEQMQLLI